MTSIGQKEIASSNGELVMHDSAGDVGIDSITGEQRHPHILSEPGMIQPGVEMSS